MKQVVLSYKNGDLAVMDVPAPLCRPGGLLVRTVTSLISSGTERGMMALGKKSIVGKALDRPDLVKRVVDKARKEGVVATFKQAMGRLDTPSALGYSLAGMVVEVGAGVTGFSVGDRVACIGAGFASHAELNWIPVNLCAHLPDEVPFEEGAYGMLGIIALHGVRCANPQLGQKAVVLGLGLLGQLAVQELFASGVSVFGIDPDPTRVELARKLGAGGGCTADRDAAGRVLDFTNGIGADSIVITAATHDDSPIKTATDACAHGGKIVLVGVCAIKLDRQLFWEKEIEFVVSRASGPGVLDTAYEAKGQDYPREYVPWTQQRNLSAFLDLLARGRVDVATLTTHRFPIEKAEEAYGMVEGGTEPHIGVLLQFPEEPDLRRTVELSRPRAPASRRTVRAGIIGAGLFGRALFLPALGDSKDIELVGLATATGVNSNHYARKFRFEKCTTDHHELLEDPDIDAVFILTRHDLHAGMVCEALAAGKHVFVEKPLCLTEEELSLISEAHRSQPDRVVMVGYNRRFATLTRRCLDFLGDRKAPATVLIRINAGAVPADHWAHSQDEGGGRIVSEGCHYFDLAMALTGEMPVSVFARQATAASGLNLGDEAGITLTLSGGSVAQILYTGAGDRSFSRERVELFSGGAAVSIEDWKSAELCRNNRRKVVGRFNLDLGYEGEINTFVQAIRGECDSIPFEVFAASTLATLRAVRSMGTGKVEDCSFPAAEPV